MHPCLATSLETRFVDTYFVSGAPNNKQMRAQLGPRKINSIAQYYQSILLGPLLKKESLTYVSYGPDMCHIFELCKDRNLRPGRISTWGPSDLHLGAV